MQMKRVTTMKGILIWNCNSIRYLIQTMGSRTKFFLEILATLASWCKNLKISYSSFCMQLHLLFWSVCISYFLICPSNNSHFIEIIINKSQAFRISNIKYVWISLVCYEVTKERVQLTHYRLLYSHYHVLWLIYVLHAAIPLYIEEFDWWYTK